MAIVVTVDGSGAVFDGEWEPIMFRYHLYIASALGDRAKRRIREYLPTQYMYLGHNGGDPIDNPPPADAGFLVAHIEYHRETLDSVLVTDGGYPAVIYGPWIEGIAPGNMYFGAKGRAKRGLSPRFAGYHTFQKVTYELNGYAEDFANVEFQPYLDMINELFPASPRRILRDVRPGCHGRVAGEGREPGPIQRGRELGHG